MDEAGLGRAIFADVDPNPTEINLDAGLKVYRDGGHDGVIAFGGGSGLDLGKMVAFMSGQTDRSGISRMSATGGPAPTRPVLHRLSPSRRLREPVRKSDAPA